MTQVEALMETRLTIQAPLIFANAKEEVPHLMTQEENVLKHSRQRQLRPLRQDHCTLKIAPQILTLQPQTHWVVVDEIHNQCGLCFLCSIQGSKFCRLLFV